LPGFLGTFTSMLIAQSRSPIAVQVLGHGSITITMDTYGHLFQTRTPSPATQSTQLCKV
jgi:integrase